MRRKVIQDFANVFCQRIAQLPEGYDLAAFVHQGSGTYELNILTGECSLNESPIPKLRTCDVFKDWQVTQLDTHNIPRDNIKLARLKIRVGVSDIDVERSFGHESATAYFTFDCASEIATFEKAYTSHLSHEQTWGFACYYNELYGSALPLVEKE